MIELNDLQKLIWLNNYKAPSDNTILDTFRRVANTISAVEDDPLTRELLKLNYFKLMSLWKFLPGGRITANVGTGREKATLYNCFVYNPQDFGITDIDSMEIIFDTLKKSAKILASLGGLGINVSYIRPNGSYITGTGARTPGVVKFLLMWDKASLIITMGSTKDIDDGNKPKKKIRKGAMLASLSLRHADIKLFITVKQQSNKLSRFNLSVLVSDKFMQAVQNDLMWQIGFPNTNWLKYKELWDGNIDAWVLKGYPFTVTENIPAKELWNLIMMSTYTRNEPGVLFFDTLNDYNPVKYALTIMTTNPCLTGDTLIAVADGRNAVTIRQLSLLGREFPVYSMGLKVLIVSGKAFKTKLNATVVRVILDDNSIFLCTPDHKIMLRNGLYKEAKDLKEKDSLMSFNSYISNKQYRQISSNVSGDRQQYRLMIALCNNHKVKRVLFLQLKYDVYDITVNSNNHNFGIITSHKDEKFIESSGVFVHNCGEIGMSSGVCNLGSLNLPRFYNDGEFDYESFELAIKYGVCFLDGVCDVSYIPLPLYYQKVLDFRRIGLGVTGLGSLLSMLGLKFGSYEAIKFVDLLFKFKCLVLLITSAFLGKTKGSFLKFDRLLYFSSKWWYLLPISYLIKRLIEKIGYMRNSVHSDVPPSGNSSIFVGQVSNGIEPVFMQLYTRWVTMTSLLKELLGIDYPKTLLGLWYETLIFKAALRGNLLILRGLINGTIYLIDKNRGMIKPMKVMDYGYRMVKLLGLSLKGLVDINELKVLDHINMLATSAKYINQNQSKTINIPLDYTYLQFQDVYIDAWRKKIKGITTYRAGTMTAVLLDTNKIKTVDTELSLLLKLYKLKGDQVILSDVVVPNKSYALQYKIKDKNKKKWYFTIPCADKLLTKPFAIFIRTNHRLTNLVTDMVINALLKLILLSGVRELLVYLQRLKYNGQSNVDKIGRALGMALRHNIQINKIVLVLLLYNDGLSTLMFNIRKVLSSFIKDGTKILNKLCLNCGLTTLVYQAGCSTCSSCGFSKCS